MDTDSTRYASIFPPRRWPRTDTHTLKGPSLLLLPPIFHALYSDLGTSLESHLDLIKCDPNYVVHFHDGESVVLSTDRAQLRAEVERFEGVEGGEALEGFLTYVQRGSFQSPGLHH